jgi:PKD repeat protein
MKLFSNRAIPIRAGAAAFVALLAFGGGCHDSVTGVQPSVGGMLRANAVEVPVSVSGVAWVGAGNIATCSSTSDDATGAMLDTIPGIVFTTGNSTSDGAASSFTKCYDPAWGRVKARTRPAPGKKEYNTSGASPYYTYYGANAGDPALGYYSYDTGDWHVVVLNTNLSYSAGSAQEQWLNADLATNSKLCQAAVWQLPRFYSSDGSTRSSLKAVWDDLYAAGVDVVVNGDWSWYERFAPQNSAGAVDSLYGIREFIAGTGGQGFSTLGTPYANSEVRIANTFGLLRMTLGSNAYAWKFLPSAGKTASDSGTYFCHGAPTPTARPGGPYTSGAATMSVDGSTSTDPLALPPLTYTWNFGDGTTGSGAKTTHTYVANGTYTITLTVKNAKGVVSAPATTTASVTNLPDDPAESPVLVGAGNTGTCSYLNDDATGSLLDGIAGTVFTVGNQTVDGADTTLTKCYGPSWGRQKARTHPAAGLKDYNAPGAMPYYNYFAANAGEVGKGYYSYDLGEWHVVVLNTNVAYGAGSVQEQWLRADLAASSKLCQAAIWQLPRFYSNDGSTRSALKAVWDDLYAAGVEIIANGDWSWYERFAPQNAGGVADPSYGIREFIVGTGGQGLSTLGTPYPNSEVRIPNTFGVLRMKLNADSYSWQFVPVAGSTATDIGHDSCHPAPIPLAATGGPYTSEADVQFDAGASTDPNKLALTYAWSFGDGSTATGPTPMHRYPSLGTYNVTLTVTNSAGVQSLPATTTATIANLPPTVMGNRTAGITGNAVKFAPLFDDGIASGPWSYQITWGDGTSENGAAVAPGAIPLLHSFPAAGTYSAVITVTDAAGASGAASMQVAIANDVTPPVVLAGAGDIADCGVQGDEQTASLLDGIDGTVFTLGDNVYENGTAAEYANCYAPSWGRLRNRTRATIGNHEYATTTTASPTFAYFGAGIGVAGKGYYSYEVGSWHVIVLNSFIDLSEGSAQYNWLQSDLAASNAACTMAMWHHPLFSSGSEHGNDPESLPAWRLLYAAGAEIVLNGHDHDYERFARQSPDGVADPNGIREFVVGTGGKSNSPFTLYKANSEVQIAGKFGVIKLTLTDGQYQWQFVQTDGTIGDSGTESCH